MLDKDILKLVQQTSDRTRKLYQEVNLLKSRFNNSAFSNKSEYQALAKQDIFQPDILEAQGLTAGADLNIGNYSFLAKDLGITRGTGYRGLLVLSDDPGSNFSILLHPSAYTIIGDSLEQTMTNKTLTTPIIGIIKPHADFSLTLPQATDTLVGKATTDALTNKTINESAVTAHQAVLAVKGSLLTDAVPVAKIPSLDTAKITTGTFADVRIAESSVTQHQAAILTGITAMTFGDNIDVGAFDFTARNLAADIAIAAASVVIGGSQLLKESAGELHLESVNPGIVLKDTDDSGDDVIAYMTAYDENDVAHWTLGEHVTNTFDFKIQNYQSGGHILMDTTGVGEFKIADTFGSYSPGIMHMIGAANKKLIPMTGMFEDASNFRVSGGRITSTAVVGSFWVGFYLPLPPAVGNLTLHIDDLLLGVNVADATDYVTRVVLTAVSRTATSVIFDNNDNRTSAGDYTYATAATDIGTSYQTLNCQVNMVVATTNDLKIVAPMVYCYYA